MEKEHITVKLEVHELHRARCKLVLLAELLGLLVTVAEEGESIVDVVRNGKLRY
jgi:hypothetical protein